MCAFARDFLQKQDCPGRNLLQRASRTPEELLSVVHFPRRLPQRGSQSGEECSGVIPYPQRGQFFGEDNCTSLILRPLENSVPQTIVFRNKEIGDKLFGMHRKKIMIHSKYSLDRNNTIASLFRTQYLA
jgi:hypothetical protein